MVFTARHGGLGVNLWNLLLIGLFLHSGVILCWFNSGHLFHEVLLFNDTKTFSMKFSGRSVPYDTSVVSGGREWEENNPQSVYLYQNFIIHISMFLVKFCEVLRIVVLG